MTISKKSISVWGPATWLTLHVVAHTAPVMLSREEQDRMKQYLTLVAEHLPCPKCREHFEEFLRRRMTASAVSTRNGLIRLLNDAHNEVNRRRGKPTWSLEDHMWEYKRRVASPTDTVLDLGSFILGIACVLLLSCFLVRQHKRVRLRRCRG